MIAIAAVVVMGLVLSAQPPSIALYVGPQVRDGFVDVDQGILDSIRDITTEIAKTRQFTLVAKPEDARLVWLILGRHTPGVSGGVAVPIGGMTMMVPAKRRAIESLLRVGVYERRLVSEDDSDDTWRAAARRAVRDLVAWTQANQSALQQRR